MSGAASWVGNAVSDVAKGAAAVVTAPVNLVSNVVQGNNVVDSLGKAVAQTGGGLFQASGLGSVSTVAPAGAPVLGNFQELGVISKDAVNTGGNITPGQAVAGIRDASLLGGLAYAGGTAIAGAGGVAAAAGEAGGAVADTAGAMAAAAGTKAAVSALTPSQASNPKAAPIATPAPILPAASTSALDPTTLAIAAVAAVVLLKGKS